MDERTLHAADELSRLADKYATGEWDHADWLAACELGEIIAESTGGTFPAHRVMAVAMAEALDRLAPAIR
jgi:hypothetical protein